MDTEKEALNNALDIIAEYSKITYSTYNVLESTDEINKKFIDSLLKEFLQIRYVKRYTFKTYLRPVCFRNFNLACFARERFLELKDLESEDSIREAELYASLIECYLLPFDTLLASRSEGHYDYMKKDYYYYIAKNSVEFLIQVKKLLEVKFKGVNYKTLKFIDVGCGIGDKVLLASFVFELICDGVEYNSHYYELAQFNKSVTREKVAFIKKDAFEMSFEAYDFVYMYCPIQDADLMEDLNIHIWRTLKKGAIFYDIGSEHNPAFKRLSRRKKGLLTREQPYFCK